VSFFLIGSDHRLFVLTFFVSSRIRAINPNLKQSFMKTILTTVFFIISIIIQAQDVVPLFNTHVEVKYAMLSPDGKNLVVATAGDSILVIDAVSLVTKRIVSGFTSTSTMSATNTGRKIFHATESNLVYVTRKAEAKVINLVLRSETLETGIMNYEIPLSSISKEEYEREKLYNRFMYGMNVSDNTLVYFLNENIFIVDIATGKVINKFTGSHSVSAFLSDDQKLLAIATPDSIKLRDMASGKMLWRVKAKTNGLHFLGEKLISFGQNIFVIDAMSGKEIRQINYSPGQIYGLEETHDKKNLTFSNSYFDDHGFAGTIDRESLSFTGVYHLPKTEGYTSFFHPVSNQHWLITLRGELYRFAHNDNPKPISQSGHHGTIKSFEFSRDRRSLVTASNGGEIIIWDLPSSRVKERFNTNIPWMEKVVFDNDEQNLFCISNLKYNKIHRDIPTNVDALAHNVFFDPQDSAYVNNIVRRETEQTRKAQQLAQKFDIDSDKNMVMSVLYIVGEGDFKLRVANLQTGNIKDFPLPDNLTALEKVAFYKPNVVVAEGIYNTIVFVDITTGKIIKRLGKDRNTYAPRIDQIIFNETGDTLASVSNGHVQLWDLRQGESIFDLNLGKRASQNGALDYRKGKLTFIAENNNNYFATVADVATGSLKMIVYADTSFHQRVDLVELQATKAPGYPSRMKLSPDGKNLLVLRVANIHEKRESFIDWWDLGTMRITRTFAMTGLEFPCWEVSWDHQRVAVWDFNGTSLQQQKLQNDQRKALGLPAITSYAGIRIFDLKTGKLDEISLDKIKITAVGETSVRIMDESELWVLDTYENTLLRIDSKRKSLKGKFDLTTYGYHERVGKLFSVMGTSFIYAVHPYNDGYINQFRKWDGASNSVTARSNSNSTPITSFSEIHSSGVFAIGLADNTISLRSSKDLKEMYHIVQDDDGHYAFMTPDNFYKATRTSAAALQFSWKNKSFSLQQFDAWFHRPDKVLAATGLATSSEIALLEKAFVKRVRKSSGENLADMLKKPLPVVSISNIDAIPLQTFQDSIKIEVRLSAHASSISTLTAAVNGVPLRKIPAAKSTEKSLSSTQSFYIPLVSGQNKIAITVQDAEGVSSLPDEVVIELATKRQANLYLFTVAIADYKNSALKLNYAVKDARDIANFFSHDKRFGKVIIDSLFNTDVTEENVRQIRAKLRNAKPDDMVIIFLAGHGLLDENFDFRFGTWALDITHPDKTAILYEDIEKLLDGVRPINKLLLIDACHSGSIDKSEITDTAEKMIQERFGDNRAVVKQQTFEKIKHNVFNSGMIDRTSFEMMQDLFMANGSQTGAQVVVATAGDSYAIESTDWQNGFFTYSFLNGLKSGSADTNHDHSITVDEIIRHVKDEVKRMSGGKQLPRLREENPENYFEVWRY
jgi:WD40 repeat protein